MAGRPKIFDQQKALEKASKLFWEKGYEATSLDDLIVAMGIQKGSFYHSFGSKKQLFIESIKLYEKISFTEYERLLKETKNPIELIKAFFLHCADSPKSEHLKGCFAGNTLTELTGIDEELTRNAKDYLKRLENIFLVQISIAQKNKTIKNKTEPKILARYLLNLWNGINITRRIYQSSEDLKPLIEFQLSILN
jgi:TetR/AcrR family transcriptional regulator, transcriptional repressor for nem operon